MVRISGSCCLGVRLTTIGYWPAEAPRAGVVCFLEGGVLWEMFCNLDCEVFFFTLAAVVVLLRALLDAEVVFKFCVPAPYLAL